MPLPFARRPSRGSVAALERLREQARLQFEARVTRKPRYELLPAEPAHGLGALPVPSALDIFLDLEGDRQAEHGGFDYLFGYAYRRCERSRRLRGDLGGVTGRREGGIRKAHRLHHRTSRPRSRHARLSLRAIRADCDEAAHGKVRNEGRRAGRAVACRGLRRSLPNRAHGAACRSRQLLHQETRAVLWARARSRSCSAHLDICERSSTRSRRRILPRSLKTFATPSARTTVMTASLRSVCAIGWSGYGRRGGTARRASSAPCTAGVEVE